MNRSPFDPGPLADVDCLATEDGWTLVFVRELAHPPEDVWEILTDPAELRRWSPFTADRNLGRLGAATLMMIDGAVTEELAGEVTRADRPTALEYTWGADLLSWTLEETAGGTRLTLRHTVAGEDWVPKVAAGWHLCLAVAERRLAGDPVGPIVGERAKEHGWEELHDAYAERLGISGTGWPTPEERGSPAS
jgi:uncharacterized protein YndB with AHSA1/START domain